jgi:hypothetical protein
MRRTSTAHSLSTAFRTTFVTTRTPLHRQRNAERLTVIYEKAKVKYFSPGDWTAQISLNRQAKMDFPRTQFLNGFCVGAAAPEQNRTDLPDRHALR